MLIPTRIESTTVNIAMLVNAIFLILILIGLYLLFKHDSSDDVMHSCYMGAMRGALLGYATGGISHAIYLATVLAVIGPVTTAIEPKRVQKI